MGTDTKKSTSQNQEAGNAKKTLTLNPTNPSPSPPNIAEESNNPSTKSEPELGSGTVSSVEVPDKKDVDDSNAKLIQASTTPISPTGSSGTAADVQKKLRRAERFGVPVQLSEEEKRNSRAERFGTGTAGSEASMTTEEQKRKARAERFGLSVPAGEEAKKKARLARFGSGVKIDPLEEEKRKARALRFSQPVSSAVPHINGEGSVEPKTATAGDASGGA